MKITQYNLIGTIRVAAAALHSHLRSKSQASEKWSIVLGSSSGERGRAVQGDEVDLSDARSLFYFNASICNHFTLKVQLKLLLLALGY